MSDDGTLHINKLTAEDLGTYYSPEEGDHMIRDSNGDISATARAQIEIVANQSD